MTTWDTSTRKKVPRYYVSPQAFKTFSSEKFESTKKLVFHKQRNTSAAEMSEVEDSWPNFSKTSYTEITWSQGQSRPRYGYAREFGRRSEHGVLLDKRISQQDLYLQPPSRALKSAPVLVSHVGPPELQIYRIHLPSPLLHLLDQVVSQAELHAQNLFQGWHTHLYSLTKQDLPVAQMNQGLSIVQPLTDFVCAQIRCLYQTTAILMDDHQPHVLKYDASSRGVQLHRDRCDVTCNLLLNEPSDFTGGGTYFAAADTAVKLKRGELLLHPGPLLHSGLPITSGRRYLLVYFCLVDGHMKTGRRKS